MLSTMLDVIHSLLHLLPFMCIIVVMGTLLNVDHYYVCVLMCILLLIFLSDNPPSQVDFDKTVRNLTFPGGTTFGTSKGVAFPIIDDDIHEQAEGFIIVLDVGQSTTNAAVTYTSNLRTTLARINNIDRELCH